MDDVPGVLPPRPAPVERRRTIFQGDLGRAEVLSVARLTQARTPTVHTPGFQILFPLAGVFNWHLGSTCSLVDVNQLLFIAPGDESQDSHPSTGDVEALLVTPRAAWEATTSGLRAWSTACGRRRRTRRAGNSPAAGIEALVSEEEDLLVIAAKDRGDALGAYDLYFSKRAGRGWSEPLNPGAPINSPGGDFRPGVSGRGTLLLHEQQRFRIQAAESTAYF